MVFKSEFEPVEPDERHKGLVSNFFWHQLDLYQANTLLVDYASGRQWTGAQVKHASRLVAQNLIGRLELAADFDCVSFCYNRDHLQLAALGVLFAGGSLCAGAPDDPEYEHAHMLHCMAPALVLAERAHVDRMLVLGAQSAPAAPGQRRLAYKLVVMDDAELSAAEFEALEARAPPGQLFGFHRHLLGSEPAAAGATAAQLPVQVSPERPAFVLLTSGSTGKPKPVKRSQRNSLYVCHLLEGLAGQQLWQLDTGSVIAGHLQLDHGTGIFCLKMTLAKGLKLVLMHGYQYATMLDAVATYGINHVCLGSALLHNMLTTAIEQVDAPTGGLGGLGGQLGSLENLLAVGSPIASYELVDRFMAKWPRCSVRQAYGMTECGLVAMQKRAHVQRHTVGSLLPNLELKLLNCDTGQEITEFRQQGELYIRGPTVSQGYLGAQLAEQTRAAFQPDGFYRTNDLCHLEPPGLLAVRGRFSEILCLHDGWKVLPGEIESVIISHPLVQEAAVVGIPHPELPTCQAPRAYVVPKEGVAAPFADEREGGAAARADGKHELMLTKEQLFAYTAERLSEPKHPIGGIKFLRQLPRIAIGKVDKKLLRKQDGFV